MSDMEYLLDSYAWMEYFAGNSNYAKYIEAENQQKYTAATTITEVVRSFIRKKIEKKEILDAIKFINEKSIVLPLTSEQALKAGFIAEELGLHFSDALIYSFATKERKVVTGDDHFKKFENVEFIE